MPREVFGSDFAFLNKDEILTYEEIDRLAGLFISLGVEKIRLSGEPLLRRDLDQLISRLALHDVEIAMTTNGVLLPRYAPALSAAGLDRVTVVWMRWTRQPSQRLRIQVTQSLRFLRGSKACGVGRVGPNQNQYRGQEKLE